jgi:hypothetical protein
LTVVRRGGAQGRLVRTIVLGAIALVAGLAWLARQLGIDADELLSFARISLILVLGTVLLGVLGAALLRGLKWLLRRR